MVAIDLIVQHVHSQLEEVSHRDTEENGATLWQNPAATLEPASL